MTKQEKLEEIKNQISQKFGNKTLNLVLMISDERFGEKSKLKMLLNYLYWTQMYCYMTHIAYLDFLSTTYTFRL